MPDELADVLQVVGDRWALLIVRDAALGLRRFEQLQESTGAPRAVLADRLRKLVAAGLLERRGYQVPGRRLRHEYALTDAGLDLLPVLAAFTDWGARHGSGESPARVGYRHLGCGGQVAARLVCECGESVTPQAGLVAQIDS